jgi:hypothetical protein
MLRASSNPTTETSERWNSVVARKLYEICTVRGYVDDRDWSEAVREVLAEEAKAGVPLRQPRHAAAERGL